MDGLSVRRIKQAEKRVVKANVDTPANLDSLTMLDLLQKRLRSERVLRSEGDVKQRVRKAQSNERENELSTAKAEQSKARTDVELRQWL